MKRLFLLTAVVALPLISKAQYFDMLPGSAIWMYQKQQEWNAQSDYWNFCNQAYMQHAAQALQQQFQNMWQNDQIANQVIAITTPVSTNSSCTESRASKKERCSTCGGTGYVEKLMYFGSSHGNRMVRRSCSNCVRGWVRNY